jgi:hypothetical protein
MRYNAMRRDISRFKYVDLKLLDRLYVESRKAKHGQYISILCNTRRKVLQSNMLSQVNSVFNPCLLLLVAGSC